MFQYQLLFLQKNINCFEMSYLLAKEPALELMGTCYLDYPLCWNK